MAVQLTSVSLTLMLPGRLRPALCVVKADTHRLVAMNCQGACAPPLWVVNLHIRPKLGVKHMPALLGGLS